MRTLEEAEALRAELRAQRRDILDDMHRDCDTNTVHRCRVCGGVTSVHYGQPPECDCEPVDLDERRAFFDEDDEP